MEILAFLFPILLLLLFIAPEIFLMPFAFIADWQRNRERRLNAEMKHRQKIELLQEMRTNQQLYLTDKEMYDDLDKRLEAAVSNKKNQD